MTQKLLFSLLFLLSLVSSEEEMAFVPGGEYTMGSSNFYPEEAPTVETSVSSFFIDKHEITNKEFSNFVEATSYVTFAEKAPKAEDYPDALPELLVPGSLVFQSPNPSTKVDLKQWTQWWNWVVGANWKTPKGPNSNIEGKENHPVVHISFEDAEAYCSWLGKQLPTEAQWEYAARGGLKGAVFPWGNDFQVNNTYMANTWQGNFPYKNDGLDGYLETAPVGSYSPNGYGLYDMAGNVWEWTKDIYERQRTVTKACCPASARKAQSTNQRVLKGGSYLCAPNYCLRYRPAARIGQTIDSTTEHTGFRCIKEAPPSCASTTQCHS